MATRKQLAFDLDTEALKLYYPTDSWRNAYDIIERHMKKYGFEHRQGSVYVSKKQMESAVMTNILIELVEKYPWLHKCMRDCIETNVGREHSKNHIFDKGSDIPTREHRQQEKPRKTKRRILEDDYEL